MECYEKVVRIGQGTYGKVYKVRDVRNGKFFALKRIQLREEEDEGIPSNALREISCMKELDHPNIVRLIDVMFSTSTLNLVFELMEMDLKQYIDIQKHYGLLPLPTVKSLLYQTLHGIAICHENKILHRDLKPQNLLIGSGGELKITDFGLARANGYPARNVTSDVVTLWYRPPDVLLGNKKYNATLDIWSIGCIFIETMTTIPPFHESSPELQVDAIFRALGTPTSNEFETIDEFAFDVKIYPPPPSLHFLLPNMPEDVIQVLTMMLQCNPTKRSMADEILKHSFFADVVLPPGIPPRQFPMSYKDKKRIQQQLNNANNNNSNTGGSK